MGPRSDLDTEVVIPITNQMLVVLSQTNHCTDYTIMVFLVGEGLLNKETGR
jgi:hypothetical protein